MTSLRKITALIVFLILPSCAHMFFHPQQGPYRIEYPPFSYMNFSTKDGYKLQGRLLASHSIPSKGVIIHFHGNAGNLDSHFQQVQWLTQKGYDVFMFDYREFGESQGQANREGLVMDSRAAIRYIIDKKRWQNIYLFGQSLGGNMAIAAVTPENRSYINAIVVDSTFFSYAHVANDFLGGTFLTYPLTWVLIAGNCYSARDHISQIKSPIFIFHGEEDEVVDIYHGQQLIELATSPKQFLAIKNCKHLQAISKEIVRNKFVAFLDSNLRREKESSTDKK